MAASSSILTPLDVKYKIKRPGYTENDLQNLLIQVSELRKVNDKYLEVWLDRPVLIRFLKAFLTVEQTVEALKLYCNWRISYSVDDISADDAQIKKEIAVRREIYCEGSTDACGRPIVIVLPRLHDSYHNDYESLFRYIIFMLEQLCKKCDRVGVWTFCLIFDLKGFSMRNMDYQCVKKIVWFLKNCYPERLGVCLIINYPWIFYGCWEVIKLWLNDVTRSKILFCGEKELKDFIDLDKFPVPLLN